MTTLNTIIEEEKNRFDERFSPHCYYTTKYTRDMGIKDFLTTAMQRAHEAGAEERDTYWKEGSQVFVNNIIEDIENMKGVYSANDAIAKALDIIKKHTIR